MPLTSAQPFGFYAALRTGQGYFQCDADLPHRSVVTRVRFTLQDNMLGIDVRECALARTSLLVESAGATSVMVTVPRTDTGPTVRLSTTTISNATVDRANYAYYLQCYLEDDAGSFPNLGIWGADVTFKITGANG